MQIKTNLNHTQSTKLIWLASRTGLRHPILCACALTFSNLVPCTPWVKHLHTVCGRFLLPQLWPPRPLSEWTEKWNLASEWSGSREATTATAGSSSSSSGSLIGNFRELKVDTRRVHLCVNEWGESVTCQVLTCKKRPLKCCSSLQLRGSLGWRF